MLTWFPTPYPGELFYGILCRYYVASGIREHNIVKRQLFGNRAGIKMASLYPNAAVYAVLSQLPEGVFDGRDMILHHSPFAYYTRMYQPQEREALLDDLLQGRGKTPTHLWKTFPRGDYALRYCPLCVQEDTQIYGEPYYHVEHQIPLSSVCVRHKCRLKQIAVANPRLTLNNSFCPLGMMEKNKEPDMNISPAEQRVSELVREYWMLPETLSPPVCNNLYQTMLNCGYMTIARQTGIVVDKSKLYAALCNYHGTTAVEKAFGTNITTSMMNRIKTWEQLVPDRYILIQAMLGLPTKTVFDPEPVRDNLREKMERMAAQGGFCTLRQVARTLGVKQYEVNAILRHYNMAPFWRPEIPRKNQTPHRGLLRCTVDEAELERIRQYSQELGYRCEGAFALDCIRYVMEQEKLSSRWWEAAESPVSNR